MSTPLIPLSKQVSRVWDSGTNNPHSLFAQSANQCLQRINNQLELKSCVLLSSSTLCINTNLINPSFLTGVWEHAVRRQEDQTVGLANLSEGLPHLLPAAVGQFPAAATPVLIAAANFLSPLSPSLCLGIDDDGGLQSATFTASAYQDIDQVSRCPIFAAFYSTVKEKEKKYLSCKSAFSAYKLCSGRTIDSVTDYGSWYIGLRQCGMDKSVVREILSTLHGIMLIGNHEKAREDYEEGCSMVGLIPSAIEELPRETIVVALFNRLVVRMINCVNESLAKVFGQEFSDDAAAVINLVEMDCKCHQTKIQLLRATFSDDFSINSEMINDGLHVPRAPKYIVKEMKSIVLSEEDADEKENQLSEDSQFVGEHLNSEFSFLSGVQDLVPSDMNFGHLMNTTRVWTVYGVETGDITDTAESWFFEDYVNRATEVDYTADFTHDEFFSIYSDQLFGIGIGQLTDWARGAKGWASSEFAVGNERIWVSEQAWNYLEASKDCEQQYSLGGSDYGEESVIPYDCSFEDYEVDSLNREYLDRPTAADYGYDTEAVGQQTLQKLSGRRKLWLVIVKLLTWWIPSPLLSIGGMKRSEVRIAWREKVAICILIALANILILFYMIFFAKLLCPDYDHVWGPKDVSQHQGPDDFFVSIHGKVYDLSKFYKLQHSDSNVKTNSDQMLMFAGQDVSPYFPKPLSVFCPDLVKGEDIWLTPNKTVYNENAVHYSGSKAPDKDSALASKNWYTESLEPALKSMYKGDLVYTRKNVTEQGDGGYNYWAIVYGKIYDLTDYFHTLERETDEKYEFLDKRVSRLFMQHAGEDITDKLKNLDVRRSVIESNLRCISNVFYSGGLDYRDSIRCQFSNYLLLVIAIIMCSAIVVKFIAAFQLGTKKVPNMCDRFVICHFPVYTEGEDEIRRALDSITALEYPNDRKLLFVVCDGMVVGSGNDLPTPHVLLNILGNTAGTNQSTHAFQSVGKGSKQLNYGQVYSGIYENNGNVVPYLVVVKIGAPNETSKPGNRGKRDSQLLVMNFFNRVHFQDRMNPLQLELFHHLNNIIGVDPELYEYLLMVDADTQVAPDSLNRLVSSCVYDTRIAGICGETKLENENESVWTMIQVYEYYISHHLTKAFESLFGSVTCLPGCFSMYRLKSPHGEPLIISNKVISDYFQVSNTTLHEKNLLSLGEDRFLTTLMIKYFPKLRFCFNASAKAATTAPNSFSILLSQRRRWINSTVHNLVELLRLHTMCGLLSVFDMRFFVFIDLAGTILLPSVCAYIGYLIYKIVTVSSQLPIISIIMISAVYGLQAVLFIIRREWQHVGWLLVYLIAYPVHSFLLPVYSFWKQDDFSWGNTRVVYGEKGKPLLYDEESEPFDPLSIPRQFWTTHALIHGLHGAHREYEPGAEAGVSVVRAVEDVLEEMDFEKITVKDVKIEVEKRLGYPAPEIDEVVEKWIDKRTL